MEGENSKTFTELSQEVAEKFLHTIVFVDDQAGFIEQEQPKKLDEKPGRGGGQGKDAQESSNERNTHELDAKKVIDVFAWKGMVCSVLKPDEDEDPLGISIEAAKKADVLILDWQIYNDGGKKAMNIIKNIIASDSEESPRLRLIIVYTGERDIVKISEDLGKELIPDFKIDDDDFAFSRGHLRIVIFAKEGVDVPDECRDRVLSVKQLSEKVSVEFAKITAGLISNVALEAMSVLRDNTHLIMGRLGPEMDPPYLAHRALLPNPDDAMYYAIDIIASEFHSLLDTYELGEKTNLRAIKAWIDMKNSEGTSFNIKVGGDDVTVDPEILYEWQRVGIEESDWFKERITDKQRRKISNHGHKTLTQTFCTGEGDANELDCKFAMLTSLKNRYGRSSRIPILTLGTILKEDSTDDSEDPYSFWLCIQPRCDSARIENSRNFLFLSLKEVDGEKSFDIVVKYENNDFIRLKINYTIYESKLLEFSPNSSDENVIGAKKERSYFVFDADDGVRFKWVSELKSEHAQRIANRFAAKLSRVGLDESEWLRRWANRRD
jgi:hypothetical protein